MTVEHAIQILEKSKQGEEFSLDNPSLFLKVNEVSSARLYARKHIEALTFAISSLRGEDCGIPAESTIELLQASLRSAQLTMENPSLFCVKDSAKRKQQLQNAKNRSEALTLAINSMRGH